MSHFPPPFIVFALPRSRTAWLSTFLTYRDWSCSHETMRYMRTLADVKSWLSMDCTGTAETNAAPWWRLIHKYRPDIKVLVVRRHRNDVLDSLMRLDMRGVCAFDKDILAGQLKRLDTKLDQIEERMDNVFSISFEALDDERACAAVFEHCLPYQHDREWWSRCAPVNIQCSMPTLMRYAMAHAPQMVKLGAMAKQDILSDMAARPLVVQDGMTIQEEPFETFLRDGQTLFADHCVHVEEEPTSFWAKNIPLMRDIEKEGRMQIVTARSNGGLFGYLMAVISPSLESADLKIGIVTTFYSSRETRGLPIRLHRAAIEGLRAKGVGEIFFRAGKRGSGEKLGSIYRRVGAAETGELYRLDLKVA